MNNHQTLNILGSWQDWLTVSGYLFMLLFVLWRVILTKPKDQD